MMQSTKKTRLSLAILYRTATIFTTFDLLITALYFAVIVPMQNTPLSETLGGGIKLSHRGVMLVTSFLIACVWTAIKKRTEKPCAALRHYLSVTALAYTVQIGVLACIHGFYLVTYYNEYVGIASPLLRGPSFILSFAALLFALIFPLLHTLLRAERIPTFWKLLLHCVGLMLLTYLTYVVFADAFANASSFLILCAVFVACYVFFAAFYFHLRGVKKKDENDATDYTPLYQADTPKPDKIGARPKGRT